MIRVSSTDKDLLEFWSDLEEGPIIEIDSQEPSYYKHNYGLEQIKGRNLNFALRQSGSNEFKDIGNLIIIERNGNEKLAVELAFGVSTIISRMYSLSSPIQASIISKVIPFEKGHICKFSDALSVVVHLMIEGLKPTASNTRGRLLRTYIQGLSYLKNITGFSLELIENFADKYEREEYGTSTGVGKKIYMYLKEYEYINSNDNCNNSKKIGAVIK
jgi:hypothetical protein